MDNMIEAGKAATQCRPVKGPGERFLQCKFYEDCLDFAALRNWHTFNCEGCPLYKRIYGEGKIVMLNEEQENTRICSECKKNPTISPKHSLCASCMARRSHQAKAKRADAGSKAKTEGFGMHHKEIVDSGLNLEAVFGGKYGYLVKELEKVAEDEIRTLDEEIIFILKSYLSNKESFTNIK